MGILSPECLRRPTAIVGEASPRDIFFLGPFCPREEKKMGKASSSRHDSARLMSRACFAPVGLFFLLLFGVAGHGKNQFRLPNGNRTCSITVVPPPIQPGMPDGNYSGSFFVSTFFLPQKCNNVGSGFTAGPAIGGGGERSPKCCNKKNLDWIYLGAHSSEPLPATPLPLPCLSPATPVSSSV